MGTKDQGEQGSRRRDEEEISSLSRVDEKASEAGDGLFSYKHYFLTAFHNGRHDELWCWRPSHHRLHNMRHVLHMANRGHCKNTRKRKWKIIFLFHITTAELHLKASRNKYKYLNLVLLYCDFLWLDVFYMLYSWKETEDSSKRGPSSFESERDWEKPRCWI